MIAEDKIRARIADLELLERDTAQHLYAIRAVLGELCALLAPPDATAPRVTNGVEEAMAVAAPAAAPPEPRANGVHA